MRINNKYVIKSDTLNVVLVEEYMSEATETKPSELKEKTVGYFSNPKQALSYLVNHEVMGSGMSDLQQIVDNIDSLQADIQRMKI